MSISQKRWRPFAAGIQFLVALVVAVPLSLQSSTTAASATAPAPMSSAAISETDEDRSCERVARDWTESYGLSEENVAVLSGCRQTNEGAWFLPIGPSDPRLPDRPILTESEEARTDDLRRTILEQLGGLRGAMPAWMREELDRLYVPNKQPVTGHQDPNAGTIGGFIRQYEEVLVSYLEDPNRLALLDYVGWWWSRRQAAFPALICSNRPPPVCSSIRMIVRVDAAPWPWDLEDPLTITEYLDWALENGRIAPVATAPLPLPAGRSDGCAERAFWMGQTVQRLRTALTIMDKLATTSALPSAERAASFAEDASTMTGLASEQEESDPPTPLLALNALLVQVYEDYADAIGLLSEAAETADTEKRNQGWSLINRTRGSRLEGQRLVQQLEEECGRTFEP